MPEQPNPGRRKHPWERPIAGGVYQSRYGELKNKGAPTGRQIDGENEGRPLGASERGAVKRDDGWGRGYVELHCKSNFSFLEGASHPDELVERAAELGYRAIAITDRNTLAGAVRMHCAAKQAGLKLLVGAEIEPEDAPPILLYAMNRAGYGRLSRLISRGRLRRPKGECAIYFEDVAELSEGLMGVALVRKGCGDGGEERWVRRYGEVFGDRLYVAAEVCAGVDDREHLAWVAGLCRRTGMPMVAANDVHYHISERRFLQDVLTCIREHCTLADAGSRLFNNGERYLKSGEQMARLFADYSRAIVCTSEIADRCTFDLGQLCYEYPEELCPPGMTAMAYLTELVWRSAGGRFPDGMTEKTRRLLEHELQLIEELHYEPYFLTVWDLVQFARAQGILCQGRGSAANSAVCYVLGVTNVDPERIDVLFERFVSRERNEPPDIDIDFEHERREEVFQYIYDKYGREHAGITAEVITYRPRSAVRDVGKALGLSLDRMDLLAKKLDWWSDSALPEACLLECGLDVNDRTVRQLVVLVKEILGFPRHLSQHVGGFVITRHPLCEMVPLENGAMADRTFIEWDKNDIDALGILKVDCLALGMLTALRKGLPVSLADVPAEDSAVYDMICRADTVGVFQIESRAQMSMLPRLRPRCFYDLVIEVAIVRPGPIQGGMVHPYLRRRRGEEAVIFPSEAVGGVLRKTLGVPLFQEQAMRLAIVAGGFTPGEADRLRRAMGAWRRSGQIEIFREKLIAGMLSNGLTREFAERCFEQICGFGEYGFPESHAASFALLVYASAWLKRYHPAAFACSLLNSQPMGFYAPAQLVRDAIEHGVEVRRVDVNWSGYDCGLEEGSWSPACGGMTGGGRCTRICHEALDSGLRRNDGVRGHEGADGAGMTGGGHDWSPACGGMVGGGDQGREGEGRAAVAEHEEEWRGWGKDGPALRLGMRLIKGLSRERVSGIEAARRDGPFRSVAELAGRSGVGRGVLARLAAGDAFRSMGLHRREAVWQTLALGDDDLPLFSGLEVVERPLADGGGSVKRATVEEEVIADYGSVGLSLEAHPIGLIRDGLDRVNVARASKLKQMKQGEAVRVAGLVLVRQRPGTAGGIVFFTLEDETGVVNLIVGPRVYEQCRGAARGSAALLADGRIERQGEVIHVQVSHLRALSDGVTRIRSRSRDFH